LNEPKSVAEMIGEMVRDIAVLVAVFGPLEVFVSYHFTLGMLVSTLFIGSTFIGSTMISCVVLAVIGVVVERRRERPPR